MVQRTYMHLLLSHSKKFCLDLQLFRPLFHTFLNLLVCPKAPKCYFPKFDSNATIIDGVTLWKIRDVAWKMPRPSKIMRKMKGMVKSRKLQTRAPEIGGCGSLIKDIVTGLTGAVLEYAVK